MQAAALFFVLPHLRCCVVRQEVGVNFVSGAVVSFGLFPFS